MAMGGGEVEEGKETRVCFARNRQTNVTSMKTIMQEGVSWGLAMSGTQTPESYVTNTLSNIFKGTNQGKSEHAASLPAYYTPNVVPLEIPVPRVPGTRWPSAAPDEREREREVGEVLTCAAPRDMISHALPVHRPRKAYPYLSQDAFGFQRLRHEIAKLDVFFTRHFSNI